MEGLLEFDTKIKTPESTGKSRSSNLEESDDMSIHKNKEETLVWPWMAVVANIPVRYTGDSGENLKDEWLKQGYNPIKVNLLCSTGFGIVEFGKEFDGYHCAMMFDKSFEVNKHGRKDWYDGRSSKDVNIYAWIASDDDYNSNDGLVGDYLRKHGVLKTVTEFQKEEEEKNSKLVMELKSMLEVKKKRFEEIES